MEKEQLASGEDAQKSEQKGGGIQTNLSQEGQGENKQSQGAASDNSGDSTSELGQENQPGKTAQKNSKEPGPEKAGHGAGNKGEQPQPDQPGKEPSQEKVAKNLEGVQEGSGKNKVSEEPPPQGSPPAERYYKAGEGPEAIRGARYVTVQLPEELTADSKGEARPSKASKGTRARSQVPVSNVPLPSHVPDAPTEKQQMPIEYRGLIR